MSGATGDDSWLLAGPTAPADVRRYYDGWADGYDHSLRSWGYDAPERAAGLLVHRLDGAGGATACVLDAGCGTGLAGAALRAAGFDGRIVGVDLSITSLEHARERSAYDDLHTADLQARLTFDDGAFTGVLCVGVLTYVPDTAAIWREFARVVAPGGAIVCTQRADVWDERRCGDTLDELERDGTWVVTHLSRPLDYMPGNPEFGHEIGVRYLVARTRAQNVR